MRFITLDEVLAIHERMIAIGGGGELVRDFTLLHSAIERPKIQFGGNFLYKSVWLMVAALLHSLVKNHPFEDGNKRTAYFSTMRFLYKNGYELRVVQKKIISFMVAVAVKDKTVKKIAFWLKKYSLKVKR